MLSLLSLSVLALVVAQFLPGLLAVKLLDIGRDREECYVLSAVLSGPIAAAVYLVTLLANWEPLYWIVIVYRSGLTKGTGVLSGARRIDVTMSITRIPL